RARNVTGVQTCALPILPSGPQGSDLDQIAAALGEVRPAAMLCLPDFHNPVGTLLDDEGRERWAAELDRAGTVGIIDETCAELWQIGRASCRARGVGEGA